MVLCPYLNTTVGGIGLHRNPAGNSFLDSCTVCRGGAWTCAGRDLMTADEGLRQVFEIALGEFFIESKLGDTDVKYSFPYDDTAGDPVKEATRNGVPLQWVEAATVAASVPTLPDAHQSHCHRAVPSSPWRSTRGR